MGICILLVLLNLSELLSLLVLSPHPALPSASLLLNRAARCLLASAPITALGAFWSLIYDRLVLVFHPWFFFRRQPSLSLVSYFVMRELAILTPPPYLSVFLLVSVKVR